MSVRVMFAIPLLILLVVFLLVIAVRRAVPLACAGLMGWLAWRLTHDIGAALSSSAAMLLLACWVLNAAVQSGISRRIVVALELAAGASVAASFRGSLMTRAAGRRRSWKNTRLQENMMGGTSLIGVLHSPQTRALERAPERLAAAVEAPRGDGLEGRFGGRGGRSEVGRTQISRFLDKRVAQLRGQRKARCGAHGGGFDPRQRAIVKLHYFNHAGGGAGALRAHVRYVARDAAGRDEDDGLAPERARENEIGRSRAHADYWPAPGSVDA